MKYQAFVSIFFLFSFFLRIHSQSGFVDEENNQDEERAESSPRCVSFPNDTCRDSESFSFYPRNCVECRCQEYGRMTCCNSLLKPVDWPSHCYLIANMTSCSYEMRSRKSRQKCLKSVTSISREIRRVSRIRIIRRNE